MRRIVVASDMANHRTMSTVRPSGNRRHSGETIKPTSLNNQASIGRKVATGATLQIPLIERLTKAIGAMGRLQMEMDCNSS